MRAMSEIVSAIIIVIIAVVLLGFLYIYNSSIFSRSAGLDVGLDVEVLSIKPLVVFNETYGCYQVDLLLSSQASYPIVIESIKAGENTLSSSTFDHTLPPGETRSVSGVFCGQPEYEYVIKVLWAPAYDTSATQLAVSKGMVG